MRIVSIEVMEPVYIYRDDGKRKDMFSSVGAGEFDIEAFAAGVRVRRKGGAFWTRVFGGNIKYIVEADDAPAAKAKKGEEP